MRGLRERGAKGDRADIHFKRKPPWKRRSGSRKFESTRELRDSKKFKIVEYTDEQYAAELSGSGSDSPHSLGWAGSAGSRCGSGRTTARSPIAL